MEDQKLEQMTEELDDIVDELNKENDRGDADLGPEADRLIEDIEEIEEIEDEEEKQIEEAAEESLAEAEAGENEDPEEAETDGIEAADADDADEASKEAEDAADADEASKEVKNADDSGSGEDSGKSDEDGKPEKMELPSIEQLENELSKERYKTNYSQVLKSTIFYLLVVAAVAVIIAVFILPVLQISGTSMTQTLDDGDIVVAVSTKKFETGEVVAFYFNNNILIKRVIAKAGDWVDIDEEGNVYVNGEQLDEPYVSEKAFGDCNIKLPYQVPDGKFFIMGDHRETSIDSRNQAIGCVSDEMMVGRLLFRVWPLNKIKIIK